MPSTLRKLILQFAMDPNASPSGPTIEETTIKGWRNSKPRAFTPDEKLAGTTTKNGHVYVVEEPERYKQRYEIFKHFMESGCHYKQAWAKAFEIVPRVSKDQ